MDLARYLKEYKRRSLACFERIANEDLIKLIRILESARKQRKRIFICGNGGSASTSSHLANDLGKGASLQSSEPRFKVIALTDNLPWLTALANDLDYSQVFVEQLKNHAEIEDVLIAISGSGNSANVLEAIRWAKENQMITIGLTGRPGGQLGQLADNVLFVESSHMGRIEEGHFLIQHMVSYYFMEAKGTSRPD